MWSVNTTQSNPLYAIFGWSATDVYAAGDAGTVLRFDGTNWSPAGVGSSALLAGIWASAASNVIAVGVQSNSAAAYRYTTAWQSMNVGVSLELTSVWGPAPTDLYVSGAAGTILRFDGQSWQVMPTGTTEYLWSVTGDPSGVGGGFAVGFNSTLVTGAPSTSVRSYRAVRTTGVGRRGSYEPSATALSARRTVRSLPQGAARRSVRLSHSRQIQATARRVNR